MPATTARKGSAAYEAGIREGRAMSAKARRAPEESEELENEEEMDMDMGKKPHSRKRSAKNANNTKAPMDGGMYGKKPMDGECGCKGKKGAKCDGSCGGAMRKRGDAALTPHEYLDACDLSIQDRSRSYIRARLDAAERLDLKCGKGAISKGEKCTKGAATQVNPQAQGKGSNTALKMAAAGGLVIGASYLAGRSGLGLKAGSALKTAASEIGQASKEISSAGKYGLKMQTKVAKQAASNIRGRAKLRALTNTKMPESNTLYGRVVNPWAEGAAQLSDQGQAGRAVQAAKRRFRRRDSPYASGFPLDSAALAF
jgi:hypothetical protein